jgi:hypothetical protein
VDFFVETAGREAQKVEAGRTIYIERHTICYVRHGGTVA